MIVSFILDTEYSGVQGRDKWFLKNVSIAQKEDVVIVTHEYLRDHLEEIIENCSERFYTEFEMEKIPADGIRKMDIIYVPDTLVSTVSRSQEIIALTNNRLENLEQFLITKIDEQLNKRNIEKPSLILNCLHVFKSVEYISEYYNCPIVPYVFSAVRRVHGYRQTLFMTHIDNTLFNSEKAVELYKDFNTEKIDFNIFNKREILSLIGKQHNLCLLPFLETEGQYEIGVVGEGFHITPEIYQKDAVTDDDLHLEAEKHFSVKDITTRLHPKQMNQAGVGRKHMKNDPAAFLLSCKRITTVQSQMIMKAAMWNRGICTLSKSLPYSFLFGKEFKAITKVNDAQLNFILFCYFVPDKLMFDESYWIWRMNGASATDIYIKHVLSIFSELGLNKELLYSDNRLENILLRRGCSKKEIQRYLSQYTGTLSSVKYAYLSSKATVLLKNGAKKDIFCLNKFENKTIHSEFVIEENTACQVDLYLTNDIDGFVTVNDIRINGKSIPVNSNECYIQKNMIVCSFDIAEENRNTTVEVVWSVKGYDEAF